jgi:nitrate/nitrite transport system permease protein
MTTTEITAPVAAPGVAEVLAPAVEESESIAAGVAPAGNVGPGWFAPMLGQALRSTAWFLVGGATVIALWQIVAALADGLPTPLEAAGSLASFVGDPFYDRGNDKGIGVLLSFTLQRVFVGFGLGVLVGVPAGVLLGASRAAWLAFNPVVQVLRPVSPLAIFPIWAVVLKDNPLAAVFVIFGTALWPIMIATAAGLGQIPVDQRNVARVFRFGRVAYLRHVVIPNALPSIMTGLRLSMGVSWMVIVAVEMLAATPGVGWFVWESYNAGNLEHVIAAIVLIGLIGFLLDMALLRLSRRFAVEGAQT